MTRYQGHTGNIGLDALKRELVTKGRLRPVEDVLSPVVSSGRSPQPITPRPAQDTIPAEDWTPPEPQVVRSRKEQRKYRRTGAEDHAHDLASAGSCACTKTTACALHALLVERRWHARPS
jgi:hypothetical protein